MTEFADLKDGDLFDAPIDIVDNTGGRRPIDPEWAAALGHLMMVRGQRQPIGLRRTATGFKTVWGHHRVEGRRLTDRPYVRAILVTGDDRDYREAEISENLFRRGLAPLERAADVADLVAIQKDRLGVQPDASPQSVAATARWADRINLETADATDTMSNAFGWTARVADALDLTERTIRRDLELHRGLNPDVVEAIRGLPVAQNASQLRALARLQPGEQRTVTELLVDGTAKGVTDALATLRQRPVKSPAQKAWSAIQGNWGRLSARQQKELLQALAMPAGVVITIDGETVGGGARG